MAKLLNRLRYPQKFLLVSLLFTLPLGLTTYLFVGEVNNRIEFARKELDGTQYLRPLQRLMEGVPQSQFLAHYTVAGGPSHREELVRQHETLGLMFKELERVQARFGTKLANRDQFTVLQDDWNVLQEHLYNVRPTDSDLLHTQVLLDVRVLIARVGDTSNLILDPDLDTYYLMDATLLKLPANQDLLAQIRLFGHILLTAGTVSTEARAEGYRLVGLVRANLSEITRGLEVAFTNSLSGTLRAQLQDRRDEHAAIIEHFLSVFEQHVLDVPALTFSQEEFGRVAGRALTTSFTFWNDCILPLDHLLRDRIERFADRRNLALLFTLGMGFIVAYVLIALYASIIRTVSTLAEASARMVSGELDYAVALQTQDELGVVVRSFNAVAARLRVEWRQARDESERAKAAQHALEESEQRFRMLTSHAPVGIFQTDARGGCLFVNQRWCQIAGLSPEQAMGQGWVAALHPEDRDRVSRAWYDAARANREFASEYRFQTPQGLITQLAGASVVLRDAQGLVTGHLGTIMDITSRKQAEEALYTANKRLQELANLKDNLVASVSHELRTPLTSIKEGLSLLLDQALGTITAEQQDFLQTMDNDIDRLVALINGMLDLAKIEAGRFKLHRSRVAVVPILASILKSFQPFADRRQFRTEAAAVPEVFADPNSILRVLTNLVSNAVKFTPDSGCITLAVRAQDGMVAVSVQDDGMGIVPNDLPKLFQRFSQVGEGGHRTKGTGLGLVLCKELVELHKGTIVATSELGRGSTFTFTLPCYTPQWVLEDVFQEFVQRAQQGDGGTVGLLALDVEPFVKALTENSRNVMEQAEEFVRTRVQSDDLVLTYASRWVVVLALTDAAGIEAMRQRLADLLSYWARTETGLALASAVRGGTALFPVDGSDSQTLLAKATTRHA